MQPSVGSRATAYATSGEPIAYKGMPRIDNCTRRQRCNTDPPLEFRPGRGVFLYHRNQAAPYSLGHLSWRPPTLVGILQTGGLPHICVTSSPDFVNTSGSPIQEHTPLEC